MDRKSCWLSGGQKSCNEEVHGYRTVYRIDYIILYYILLCYIKAE